MYLSLSAMFVSTRKYIASSRLSKIHLALQYPEKKKLEVWGQRRNRPLPLRLASDLGHEGFEDEAREQSDDYAPLSVELRAEGCPIRSRRTLDFSPTQR
jgi:hypothetical protein